MDSSNQSRHSLIRSALSLAAVFGLLHAADQTDALSDLARPVVVALLRLMGMSAFDHEGYLAAGRLEIPWSRDCAGLNILVLLWALALWTGRGEALSRRYFLRLGLALPVSFAANIVRILALIAYRDAMFPAVESPQLHYFIGFLCVMPFLGLFVPRSGRPMGIQIFEIFHMAAALSLLAPLVHGPGGSTVALASLLILAQTRFRSLESLARRVWFVLWLFAGLAIGLASMESLWIPWLLLAPHGVPAGLLTSWTGPILLAGTVSPVAMQPVMSMAVCIAAAVHAWSWWRGRSRPEVIPVADPSQLVRLRAGSCALLGVAMTAPFLAPALFRPRPERSNPPPVAMARPVDANSCVVRLIGQSSDLELVWHGPQGGGRHHSLPVCMRFRGVILSRVEGHPPVLTDGRQWMREFFLHRGRLLTSYGDYLWATFTPGSPVGIHIVAAAPGESMTAETFAAETERLARELARSSAQAATSIPAAELAARVQALNVSR